MTDETTITRRCLRSIARVCLFVAGLVLLCFIDHSLTLTSIALSDLKEGKL